MRTSPAPFPIRRVRRSTMFITAMTAGVVFSALLVPPMASAQDGSIVPIVLPAVTTTAAPPTTVAPTTSVPPVTAPPSTAAPETSVAPPTAAPTTGVPVTAPSTKIPTRVVPTTRKTAVSKGNPVARGATSVEVSIAKQRMYVYKGGTLYRTVRVSTGNGKKYCAKGKCGVAVTPRGRFRVYNRINGWRTSYLGRLYNPLYFRGGYAIHGSGSVPSYPASHGCVRVSMSDARWLPGVIPNGTTVWVH